MVQMHHYVSGSVLRAGVNKDSSEQSGLVKGIYQALKWCAVLVFQTFLRSDDILLLLYSVLHRMSMCPSKGVGARLQNSMLISPFIDRGSLALRA
eukprot:SAG11_NODE_30273_length_302_cov_1.024631_1_plen_94_part_10